MSSILDALKKAQQESGEVSENQSAWPAPLPVDVAYRKAKPGRWWLLALILLTVAGTCAVLFWPVRKPLSPEPMIATNTPSPGQVASAPQTAQAPVPRQAVAPPPAISPQVAHEPPESGHTVPPVTTNHTVSSPVKPAPKTAPPRTAPPEKRVVATAPPRPAASPPAAAKAPSPPSVPSEPEPAPVRRQPPATQPDPPAAAEEEKRFRDDPRIDLQALVWAPDAAQRFVVVNNRLIREGGSVDDIIVLKIDRDDVLLSDGGDRWYQRFNIR